MITLFTNLGIPHNLFSLIFCHYGYFIFTITEFKTWYLTFFYFHQIFCLFVVSYYFITLFKNLDILNSVPFLRLLAVAVSFYFITLFENLDTLYSFPFLRFPSVAISLYFTRLFKNFHLSRSILLPLNFISTSVYFTPSNSIITLISIFFSDFLLLQTL